MFSRKQLSNAFAALAFAAGTVSVASAGHTISSEMTNNSKMMGGPNMGYEMMMGMRGCGMMMGPRMRGMPHSSRLPEATSEGATLVRAYCTQCHALPSPQQHTAPAWPSVVQRMNARMQWMAHNGGPVAAPTQAELAVVTEYLQTHAAKPD